MARVFYHIVLASPPTVVDFTSKLAQGIPPPASDPETLRLWAGLSVFNTLGQARRTAQRYPRLGGYIAELHVSDDGPIRYERTGLSRGHYTLWGEPDDLLGCVVSVVAVKEGPRVQ